MMALLLAALPEFAQAADPESFNPDKGPVKIVVGFQPGGIGGTVDCARLSPANARTATARPT